MAERVNFQLSMLLIDKAIKIDPDCDDAYITKMNVAIAKDLMKDQILAIFEQIVIQRPDKADIILKCLNQTGLTIYEDGLNLRGLLLTHLGKYQEAIECYDKIIKNHKNDNLKQVANACNNKANILAYQFNDHNEALDLYNQAIKLQPFNILYHCNRGKLYDLMNQEKNALEDFNKAYEISENNNLKSSKDENIQNLNDTLQKDRKTIIKMLAELQKDSINIQNKLNNAEIYSKFKIIKQNRQNVIDSIIQNIIKVDKDAFNSLQQQQEINKKIYSQLLKCQQDNDELKKLLQKLKKDIDKQKIITTHHQKVLEDSNTIKLAQINNSFIELEEDNPKLHRYCKAFYWASMNYFAALQILSSGAIQGKTIKILDSIGLFGAGQAIEYTAEYIKTIPILGIQQGIQNQFIKYSTNNSQKNNKIKKHQQTSERKVTDYFQKQLKIESEKITKLITKMIITDLQPFQIVENTGFIELIKYLAPNYTIPHRTTFSKNYIGKQYDIFQSFALEHFKEIDFFSISSDIWTSINNDSYQSIKIKDYPIIIFIAYVTDGGKNMVNSNTLLEQQIKQYQIQANKVNANFQLIHFHCLAHKLNLVVKNSMNKNSSEIQTIIDNIREQVIFFKRSPKCKEILKQIMIDKNQEYFKPILDNDTRWNSTFNMLERFDMIYTFIQESLQIIQQKKISKIDKKDFYISIEEHKFIKEIIKILKNFEIITKEFESPSSPLSLGIPNINYLLNHIQTQKQQLITESELDNFLNNENSQSEEFNQQQQILIKFLETIEQNIRNQFKDSEFFNNNLLKMCTFLDPRFKSYLLNENAQLDNDLYSYIIKQINQHHSFIKENKKSSPFKQEQQNQNVQKTEIEISKNQNKNDEYWNNFQQKIKKQNFQQSFNNDNQLFQQKLKTEIIDYILEMELPVKASYSSVELYWKQKQNTYPILQQMVSKLLTYQIMSCSDERVFSTASQIINKQRNKINPDKAEFLILLNKNQQFIKQYCSIINDQ